MKEPFDWEKSNRTLDRLFIAAYVCLGVLACSLIAQVVLQVLLYLGCVR